VSCRSDKRFKCPKCKIKGGMVIWQQSERFTSMICDHCGKGSRIVNRTQQCTTQTVLTKQGWKPRFKNDTNKSDNC